MLWIDQFNYNDVFLYEIFDDFLGADVGGKKQIHKNFCEQLWKVSNHREIKKSYISFSVNGDLLQDKSLIQLFLRYDKLPYISYRSTTVNQSSWHLLRQKINNMYVVMCDENVCLRKDYLDCLKVSKRFYFECINNKNSLGCEEIEEQIIHNLNIASNIKEECSLHKMKLSWKQYKQIINSFLWKCFNNYKPLSDNEDSSKIILSVDYWIEDNYIISYLGKSLQGYLKNYEKEVYSETSRKNYRDKREYRRCDNCGRLFLYNSSRKKLCHLCSEYQPMKEKTITCADCGKSVIVSSKNSRTNRCPECYKKYRQEYYRKNKQLHRDQNMDVHSTI